jgi:hypothetical protein
LLKPKVQAVNVRGLFGGLTTLEVPIYQREYAWGEPQIRDLWDDFSGFFNDDQDEQYLLGQIIIAEPFGNSLPLEIVDGQQRITSLALLLAALRKRLSLRVEQFERSQFLASEITEMLNFEGKPRLKIVEEAQTSFKAILNDEQLLRDTSNSGARLVENYQEFLSLVTEAESSGVNLCDFTEKILESVWLIQVSLAASDQAIEFFERTNDRGLDLNSADLMKNLLFSEVREKGLFSKVNDSWRSAVRSVSSISVRRIASMDFLMKAMISTHLGRHVSNKKVFREWKLRLGGNKDEVKNFIELLPGAAYDLRTISEGQTPNQAQPDKLDSLRQLNMVQQYPLLLAARHLSTDSYNIHSSIVEARFILSSLSGERNGEFEKGLTSWANAVHRLSPDSSAEEIRAAAKSSLVNAPALLSNLVSQLHSIRYATSGSANAKIKTCLYLAASEFELLCENTLGVDPHIFLSKQFDIEHIDAHSLIAKKTWAKTEDLDYLNSIGNLTILESSLNRSIKDAKPSEKQKAYQNSSVMLTRVLCDLGLIGAVPEAAMNFLKEADLVDAGRLEYWDQRLVSLRANLYVSLCTKALRRTLGLEPNS